MHVAAVAGPDPGHLFPVVAVAAALRRAGHEVTVITGDRWREALEADGLQFDELPAHAAEPADEDIGWRLWGKAVAMTPPLAATLTARGVTAVVADTLTSAGAFAAERCGLPWVEVVPHWLWEPSRALPPVGLGKPPGRGVLGRLYDAHLRRNQARSFAAGRRERHDARVQLGLRGDGGPALRLLSTVPALEPPRPDWPPRTYVAGSLEWEPPTWPDLAVPEGEAPLVLVTDSTASAVAGGSLATRVVEVLGRDVDRGRLRVVATTSAEVAGRLGLRAGRGRHVPLIGHADVAVGFGGGGLVGKSLSRGVPLVLLPLQGDQRETAARAGRVGAAMVLDLESATPARLRDAVFEVLADPTFRDAARRVAWEARGLGAERAAVRLERVVRHVEAGEADGAYPSGRRRFSPTS